ncbi:hypothetical protein PIB30_010459 [Stylosanthes scabra]|uniref:Uncharacterized protein n=1 Tax=Stylosanthes scabra TaxID=79078 RepID=A0ABU6Y5M6_9FABA|nr:hypothetical protein [Stylosanthes scabra]
MEIGRSFPGGNLVAIGGQARSQPTPKLGGNGTNANRDGKRMAFGKTGKIIDIYLSEKIRRANPLKFTLIRYGSKEEARRTKEQLDRWIVWGCELKLTESIYSRSGKEKEVYERDRERRRHEMENVPPTKQTYHQKKQEA